MHDGHTDDTTRLFRCTVFLFSFVITGCQTAIKEPWSGVEDRSLVPQQWTSDDHYRCMRAYHLHQILSGQRNEIIKECRGPAQQDWAPAQTALATVIPAAAANETDEGMELFRKAAAAGEPVAISLYGGLLGGAEGRRLVGRGAGLGVIRGAAWLALKSGIVSATEQEKEDVYWATYILDKTGPPNFQATRSQYETGRDMLPLEVRRRLAADAGSILLGPIAPTPVSPQIEFDIRATLNERYPSKKTSAMLTIDRYLGENANPINRAFAHMLSEDPKVVEAVRARFPPKGNP